MLPSLGSTADIVYTALERRWPDGSLFDVLSRRFDRKALADDSFVDSNSIVLRRDRGTVFSRIPRKRATLPKEDWEFIYRLSRTRRTLHLAAPTVNYLVNTDSYYTNWTAPAPRPETTGAA